MLLDYHLSRRLVNAMNIFDMAVITIIGYCAILGIFRGFIREITGIAGGILGFYIAYTQHQALAPFLAQWVSSPVYVNIFSFILMFSVFFILVSGLGIMLRALLKAMFLGFIDRFLGAVFGSFKGLVLAVILFFLLTTFLPLKAADAVRHSTTAPALNRASAFLVMLVPESVRVRIERRVKGLKEKWDEKDGGAENPGAAEGR